MEQLENQFIKLLDVLEAETTVDALNHCLYQDTRIVQTGEGVISLIDGASSHSIPYDKPTILNHLTGKYLLALHDSYSTSRHTASDEEGEEEDIIADDAASEINQQHLHRIFLLLDLSIHIDLTYPEYANFSMNTLVNLLTYIYPISFVIKCWSPLFFGENEESTKRRYLFTKNNKLQGKVKPGSRLLMLYKQIVNKIPTYLPENQLIISKFREFILSSLDISDKLSQSLDWHLISSSTNGYNSTFAKYYTTKKLNFRGLIRNRNKNSKKSLLDMYVSLMKMITANNETQLLRSFDSAAGNNQIDLSLLDSLNKTLSSALSSFEYGKLKPIQLNNKISKPLDWILDDEVFLKQLNSLDFYWSLRIQILILINFLNQLLVDNWSTVCNQSLSEFSKFKKPENLASPIVNAEAKRRITEWLSHSLNAFKQKNFNYPQMQDLLSNNEKTFTLMKLKNFTHPSVDDLAQVSQLRKRKYSEYMTTTEDLQSTIQNKRAKFQHRLGTPRLSKLWNVKTDDVLNSSAHDSGKSKTFDDILYNVKDDIYFARGEYEQNPNDNTSEAFSRLAWKGLRSIRENSWFDIVNSNENGNNLL